jgi:hypothetical protein
MSEPSRRHLMQLAATSGVLGGALAALPSAAPAADVPRDFDFLHGSWRVLHRRLKGRLVGSTEWQTFDGTCVCQPTMGGFGNMDDNWLDLPGGAYRAMGVRAYDPKAQHWAIWWIDGRNPHGPTDPPVKGGFRDGVGTFLSDDVQEGRKVVVRYEWSKITRSTAVWEQAFSPDGGKTWEMNWHMDFTRV